MILVCSILVACDSSNYQKAEKLFSDGDYAAALKIYTSLGDYEDAKAKAIYCEREVGMTENADYAFLDDLKSSVLSRLNSPDNTEYSVLVDTELAYLEKYSKMTFYDNNLKEIADKYIEGLHVQKEALKKDTRWDYQIEWQRGLVLRYEALVDSYEKFNFLSDNPEFVGIYVADLEIQQYILNGYNAIENDLNEQMNSESFSWELGRGGYSIYCTLKNNTDYTFGMYVEVSFYDINNVLFETNTSYIQEIKPGDTYNVEVYISNASRVDRFEWNTYYDYVN